MRPCTTVFNISLLSEAMLLSLLLLNTFVHISTSEWVVLAQGTLTAHDCCSNTALSCSEPTDACSAPASAAWLICRVWCELMRYLIYCWLPSAKIHLNEQAAHSSRAMTQGLLSFAMIHILYYASSYLMHVLILPNKKEVLHTAR